MDISFSVCATDMYHKRYLDYMLKHYDDLNLPYSFPEAFGYLASPVMMDKEAVLCLNAEDETLAAFGYIHGTGEHDYTDEHVIQLQAVYISEPYRSCFLFLHGLQFLVHHLDTGQQRVSEIVFWIGENPYLQRLVEKFAKRKSVAGSDRGTLAFYHVDVQDLRNFLQRYESKAMAFA